MKLLNLRKSGEIMSTEREIIEIADNSASLKNRRFVGTKETVYVGGDCQSPKIFPLTRMKELVNKDIYEENC